MFSSTCPAFYAQAARFFPPHARHLLDYGSALGNAIGIALCVYGSSALAERHLACALRFGPAVLVDLWSALLPHPTFMGRHARPNGAPTTGRRGVEIPACAVNVDPT